MSRRLEPVTQRVRARLGIFLDTTFAQLFFENDERRHGERCPQAPCSPR
jgi:hypothetical protein